jgi:hypothetical protein
MNHPLCSSRVLPVLGRNTTMKPTDCFHEAKQLYRSGKV